MEYLIAVFKVRSQTMAFYDRLKSRGIIANIINTPKQAKVSCGISVKFFTKALPVASALINYGFDGFVGFFKIINFNGKIEVIPLRF